MNADVNMARVRAYGSTHRYFQGPGALGLAGQMCARLGKRPLLVADTTVAQLVWEPLRSGCAQHGLQLEWAESSGDVTRELVKELVETATASGHKPDVVVAAGGGKGVDTGKAVSRELGARLVVLPTSASNDGPCSESFVYYNARHEMESVEHLPRNPDAVIVDTQVLIKAPRALLISGIGDALCKLYEGQQARAANGLNLFGGRSTMAAEQLSFACDRMIRENAVAGLQALEAGVPDAAFENLTEGLVLLAGLAFENSGLSIAHSMTRGLTRVPQIAAQLHGQQVAYGLLVQFALEQRDRDFMTRQLDFHRSVGLATSLRDMGVASVDSEVIACIAAGAMTAPHLKHFSRPLEAASFEEAMTAVESLSSLSR